MQEARCHRNLRSDIRVAENPIKPIDGNIYWFLEEEALDKVSVDKYQILFSIQKAFTYWQPYMPYKFTSTNNPSKAAIIFRFKSNEDSDLPEPFGEHTLAYAYFPYGTSLSIASDVFMNRDKNWSVLHKNNYFSMIKVLVHEIGHALGLEHSDNGNDIMGDTYINNNDVNITEDTILGIRELYSSNSTSSQLIAKALKLLSFKDFNRLTETSLVLFANALNLEATKKDLKKNTINKILQFISLYI